MPQVVLKSSKIFNKLTCILYLLFLQTQALHCHRKHDHSSDVLLQSDISNLGAPNVLHHSHLNEDNSRAAKLVQLQDSDSTDISSNDNSNVTSSSTITLTKSEGVNVTRTGGGKVVAFCPARYKSFKYYYINIDINSFVPNLLFTK